MDTNTPGKAVGGDRRQTLARAWDWLATHSRWLSERTPEVRASLLGIAQLREFAVGDPVFRTRDRPTGVLGLFEGMLDLAIPRMDGEEFSFHRAHPGFWIGDLALFSKQHRLVSVRAVVASRLILLPQSRLAALIAKDPSLVGEFYQLSYQNMEMTLRLLGNLSISPAENRVALRLLAQADQHDDATAWMKISQDVLSEMVALSSQSVRRCLRSLEDAGLIEVGYGRIRVVHRQRLAATCGYTRLEF